MAVGALVAAAVASAGITGVGATVATALGVAIVGSAATTVVNFVVGAVAGRGRPDSQRGRFGIRSRLSAGVVGRSILLGRCATGGSLVYANTWGEEGAVGDAYLTMVIALSDLPIRELRGVWVSGEKVTLDDDAATWFGSPAEEYRDEDGVDHLWVKVKTGDQTTADSFLQNRVSSDARPWGADRIGDGVAYAIVTALHDRELFSGIPEFLFEVHGAALYDPTQDSSVGGDGPQRWSDPETWGGGQGDFNPAVMLYNLMRGIPWRGKLLYGLETFSDWQLPVADWISQIEICREDVDESEGKDRRYTAGGEVPLEAPVAETLEQLLAACHGHLVDSAGRVVLRCGPHPEPVAHLTDDAILVDGGQTFIAFEGLESAVNVMTATHPDPTQAWTLRESPPVVWDGLQDQDGDRRLPGDVELDFVHRREQARRLVKQGLRDGRRQRKHTLHLPPEWWVIEPGDVINWTSARHGYKRKRFVVEALSDQADLSVVLVMREVNPADFNWTTRVDFEEQVDGTLAAAAPPAALLFSVSAQGAERIGANGAKRPAIRIIWDASLGRVDGVEAVRWQVRDDSGEVVKKGRDDDPSDGFAMVSGGLMPGTSYEVRARPIMPRGRKGAWSGWISVQTPSVRLRVVDLEDEAIVADRSTQMISSVDLLANTYTTIAEVTVDRTEPGPIEVKVACRVSQSKADIRITEDNALVVGTDVNFETGGQAWIALRTARPVAGVTTFRFEARREDPAEPSAISKATLICTHIKKGE